MTDAAPSADTWHIRTYLTAETTLGSHATREIDLLATSSSRAVWETRFWQLFPREPREFIELARAHGIMVTVDLQGTPPSVKAEYSGYSASKLKRIMDSSPQGQKRPPQLERALADFREDYHDNELAQKQNLLTTLGRLPCPPPGFYWAPDNGGLLIADRATFRLWSHNFGYMPRSE